jgi:hypothetical protein
MKILQTLQNQVFFNSSLNCFQLSTYQFITAHYSPTIFKQLFSPSKSHFKVSFLQLNLCFHICLCFASHAFLHLPVVFSFRPTSLFVPLFNFNSLPFLILSGFNFLLLNKFLFAAHSLRVVLRCCIFVSLQFCV